MNLRRLWPITLLLTCSCSLEYFATGVDPSRDERSCTEEETDVKYVEVVNLGWHTGILFASADVPEDLKRLIPEFGERPAVEIGWGDAEFYMSSGYSTWKGFKAAFFSAGSAVHAAGFENDLDEYLAAAQVVRLRLSENGFKKLTALIAKGIVLDDAGKAVPLGPSLYGRGRFYAVKGETSLLYTCNSWTADALVEAGCRISKRQLRASSIIAALRGL